MIVLHGLGVWGPTILYPSPKELTGHWDDEVKRRVIDHMRNSHEIGTELDEYDDEFLPAGNLKFAETILYSDGVWHWQNDLIYYVEVHSVLLPDEFVQFACLANCDRFARNIEPDEYRVASAKWRRWCRKVRSNRVLAGISYLLF